MYYSYSQGHLFRKHVFTYRSFNNKKPRWELKEQYLSLNHFFRKQNISKLTDSPVTFGRKYPFLPFFSAQKYILVT